MASASTQVLHRITHGLRIGAKAPQPPFTLGTGVVITGSITGSGETQRLILKELDVKTAQLVSMANERF